MNPSLLFFVGPDRMPIMERRLAAILAADMVGFSRQMQEDEVRTLKNLNLVRTSIVDPEVAPIEVAYSRIQTMGFWRNLRAPLMHSIAHTPSR